MSWPLAVPYHQFTQLMKQYLQNYQVLYFGVEFFIFLDVKNFGKRFVAHISNYQYYMPNLYYPPDTY